MSPLQQVVSQIRQDVRGVLFNNDAIDKRKGVRDAAGKIKPILLHGALIAGGVVLTGLITSKLLATIGAIVAISTAVFFHEMFVMAGNLHKMVDNNGNIPNAAVRQGGTFSEQATDFINWTIKDTWVLSRIKDLVLRKMA